METKIKITFKDGRSIDIVIENFEILSDRELVWIFSSRYPGWSHFQILNGETLGSNSICPDCGGEGFNLGIVVDKKCNKCNGTGRIQERT